MAVTYKAERRRRYWASRRTGTRYHGDAMCPGLDAVRDCGDGVLSLTRAEVAERHLTPCRRCQPPPLLDVVITVSGP